jgi:DNA-binding response OmpR family regulator
MPRILLIDDDEPFRTMLRITLTKLGHEVLEAPNGKLGLRLHFASPADLVMTDLIMPEQEGLETIRQLRGKQPAVKIVAMSGGGRINARDFLVVAKMFGANRTLVKPFSLEELQATLAELLGPPPAAPQPS